MLYLEKPDDFNPIFDVVGCFLESKGRFLLLHRSDKEAQGNTWCIPAGKVEKGEALAAAMSRELFEETGISVPETGLSFWGETFVKYPEFDFRYCIYSAPLQSGNEVKLDHREHKDFKWVTPEEAFALPLIMDEDTAIKLFYRLK